MKECCCQFLGDPPPPPPFFFRRLEAQLALFDRIASVPGDIVELGVGSGVSLRGWAHFVAEHGPTRRVWGFDTFAGFPSFSPEDGPEAPAIGKRVGGETEIRERPVTEREVTESLLGLSRGGDVRVLLVRGDIVNELPKYSATMKPALVFCDADTYAPTEIALRLLWRQASPGALFVFDEYGHEPWPGETKAVDDFIAANPGLKLERLDMESGPTALVVKP